MKFLHRVNDCEQFILPSGRNYKEQYIYLESFLNSLEQLGFYLKKWKTLHYFKTKYIKVDCKAKAHKKCRKNDERYRQMVKMKITNLLITPHYASSAVDWFLRCPFRVWHLLVCPLLRYCDLSSFLFKFYSFNFCWGYRARSVFHPCAGFSLYGLQPSPQGLRKIGFIYTGQSRGLGCVWATDVCLSCWEVNMQAMRTVIHEAFGHRPRLVLA